MEYITINIPPFPYFIMSGSALYRPGDCHRKRKDIGCFDIIFVDYGDLYIDDGNHQYQLKKHDVLIIHPHRTHYGYKVSKTKTFFHWLHFNTQEPYAFSEGMPDSVLFTKGLSTYDDFSAKIICPTYQSLVPDTYNNILSILRNMESLHINKYSQTSEQNTLSTNIFQTQINFTEIMNLLCINQNQKNTSSISHFVMNYLYSNYSQGITLEQLAKLGNCHPTHLIRCFKKEYNLTPWQALINIRIQQSANMLITTNFSCQEISQYCGFQSVPYFSKTFKKYYNITPSEYRKRETKVY